MTFFASRVIIKTVEVLTESELTQCTETKNFSENSSKSRPSGHPRYFGGVLFFYKTKIKEKGRTFLCILRLGTGFPQEIGRSV